VVVKELAGALAFGAEENYVAGRTRGEVNAKEMAVGFFFGRTCFAEPLIVADRDVAKTLPLDQLPLTGAYMFGEGWFPLNEVFGIPSTCLLTLRAGAGQGGFFFVDGTGRPQVGAKYTYGVSGEILCLVEVQGEIRLVGVIPGLTFSELANINLSEVPKLPRLTLRGVGEVSGEIGVCPFCKDFSKEVGITVRNVSPALILVAAGGGVGIPLVIVDSLLNLGEVTYEIDL
jgi:hypothetical protein